MGSSPVGVTKRTCIGVINTFVFHRLKTFLVYDGLVLKHVCPSSFSDCYKLDISMFSYFFHVFSKNKIIHQLEKIFFKSLFHIFV